MSLPRDGRLLRIVFGEDDKFRGGPLCEAIVLAALAGAAVLVTLEKAQVLRYGADVKHSPA